MSSANDKAVFPMQPAQMLCLFVCVLCCFVLSSCSRPQEHSVQDDIKRYLEKKQDWMQTENQVNAAIEITRRDQFVHDDLTINVLSPFVGVTEEYVRELEKYLPKTPAVSNIHQQYIEGWRAHQFALAALVDSAQRQDYVQLAMAHTNLLQAQRTVLNTVANLTHLAEQAGVIEPSSAEEAAPASLTAGEIRVE